MCLASPKAPVISIGGLAKQYLVPGWRLGWILIYDRNDILKDVREGIGRLTTLILGANTLVQGALEDILFKTPKSYYENLIKTLKEHAEFCAQEIQKIPGLFVVVPKGAMYLMVNRFNSSTNIIKSLELRLKCLMIQ